MCKGRCIYYITILYKCCWTNAWLMKLTGSHGRVACSAVTGSAAVIPPSHGFYLRHALHLSTLPPSGQVRVRSCQTRGKLITAVLILAVYCDLLIIVYGVNPRRGFLLLFAHDVTLYQNSNNNPAMMTGHGQNTFLSLLLGYPGRLQGQQCSPT